MSDDRIPAGVCAKLLACVLAVLAMQVWSACGVWQAASRLAPPFSPWWCLSLGWMFLLFAVLFAILLTGAAFLTRELWRSLSR